MKIIPTEDLSYKPLCSAKKRILRGQSVANRLDLEGSIADVKEVRALGAKIARCAAHENIWTGKDLHNASGELFDGLGTLWACGSRLCPSCVSLLARRQRQRVRSVVSKLDERKLVGERWRLVTLTMPTVCAEKMPLLTSIKVLLRGLELFQERLWWSSTVRAAVKNLEFTLGSLKRLAEQGREWDGSVDGFHTHTHLLVLSKFLNRETLKNEWSSALASALRTYGYADELLLDGKHFMTPDGAAIVDVRLVTNRRNVKRTPHLISLEGAIQETTKYVTKCESWEQIPASQLVAAASIRRFPRMFELTGDARRVENAQNEPSVHSNGLSPTTRLIKKPRAEPLRLLLEKLPFSDWLLRLDERVARARRYRREALCERFPLASFALMNGEPFGMELISAP